ncbi:hypothetical protein AB0J14_05120 [Micromonospora arborensis]|uniref:hypothetical protein n=1 Tax=Micromonospora arborensis TaxID=2116518 RepID=UPI0033E2D0BF
MSDAKLLGPNDEPQESGAVVAVHYGDYRRQELWVSSGANIGNWYCLGGEFSRPKVWVDNRSEMDKMLWRGPRPRPGPGEVPLHPHWEDVIARGPVTLLVPAGRQAYVEGWRAGRRDLWQSMESVAEDDPQDVTVGSDDQS